MSLGSANYVTWTLFRILRKSVNDAYISKDESQKDSIILSIILAVTCVESFTNCYYQQIINSKPLDDIIKKELQGTIDKRSGNMIDKINTLSRGLFTREHDWQKGIAKQFEELKDKRNQLIHFKPNFDDYEVSTNIVIKNLTKIELITNLKYSDASEALRVAEEFVEQTIIISGTDTNDIPGAMHYWTGKMPTA
ncbi:MAG: hypothetical protein SFY68_04515 [Candidatus Sumerlaeia bacterium]|nr:hypothetical protein [Candidatus Sumerlaeia bacterium]